MKKCAMCKEVAEVRCTWGPGDKQTADVCMSHGEYLWAQMAERINAGHMVWINEPINMEMAA